ncbi:biotin-dependent carboxyltransferase family protein [Sphingobacterium oryzagri]|uniref:Biotin-dependent carboxyltransferase family protein n=1 Tax=Sphingobacterium oryzagri TaxID=3025669 RepID=A0ABY7WMG7_9SPHI|nr:biotin-dependent carboxyltransferase family protein [Sphingobacterium sp. KACC 22765]WDF69852.1 biotin-dependent carboxyltransferase family protein [Sphingobacterium sp. KACC 22765]
MGFSVLKAGMQTTIQDLGRFGFQRFGMVVGGAMDGLAWRLGNMILHNNENAAALECTTIGPSLHFEQTQLIAITGADLSARLDGVPIACWKPILVTAGSVLSFGKPVSGCRAYICFQNGLDIPQVMHSQSTYLKAKIGGWQGRALQKGDRIDFCKPYGNAALQINWRLSPQLYTDLSRTNIRVIKGPQFEDFSKESVEQFFSESFDITAMSDRMGYRLASAPLRLAHSTELLSSAVTFGTVQVPPEGQAIVLMADRPTTGGYPILAQVASVDLSLLSQKQAGDALRFELISLAEAQRLLRTQERQLLQVKRSIAFKYER